MTRQQLQQYFPDTYAFFYHLSDSHPFWKAILHVHIDDAKTGNTLLSDLEQVFSALYLVGGHHVIQEHLEDIDTQERLMEMLTQLYVAYIYRDHQPKILHQSDHGYTIELEIANQLLALGVVAFQTFDSPEIQFAAQIQDELHHLQSLGDEGNEHTEQLLDQLDHHAKSLKEHPKAQHHILAAMTDHTSLDKELALAQTIQANPERMKSSFPHIAGVILIDPTPGKEQAKFIPFHGTTNQLELLLNKHQ